MGDIGSSYACSSILAAYELTQIKRRPGQPRSTVERTSGIGCMYRFLMRLLHIKIRDRRLSSRHRF